MVLRVLQFIVQQRLFAKQIAVRAGTSQRQDENIVLDAVNQQPIWLDVAFAMTDPIPGQGVILVCVRKRFTHSQRCDHIFQQIDL